MKLTIIPNRMFLVFAWYDLWIGAYYNNANTELYLMVPFVGFCFRFRNTISKCSGDGCENTFVEPGIPIRGITLKWWCADCQRRRREIENEIMPILGTMRLKDVPGFIDTLPRK